MADSAGGFGREYSEKAPVSPATWSPIPGILTWDAAASRRRRRSPMQKPYKPALKSLREWQE